VVDADADTGVFLLLACKKFDVLLLAEAEALAADAVSLKEPKAKSEGKKLSLCVAGEGAQVGAREFVGDSLREKEGASYFTRMLASFRSVLTNLISSRAIFNTSRTGKVCGAKSPDTSS
jgi:hypothetical protein